MKPLTVKVLDQKFIVPVSWHHVKWSDYINVINLKDAKPFQYLSLKTGIPVELLEMMDINSIEILSTATSFFEGDGLKAFSGFSNELNLDVRRLPVKYIIASQQSIKRSIDLLGLDEEGYKITETDLNQIFLNSAVDFVKIYTGEDISDKPVSDVFGIACFFLLKFRTFFMSDIKDYMNLKIRSRKLKQGSVGLKSLQA